MSNQNDWGAVLSRNPPYLLDRDLKPYDFAAFVGKGWEALCMRTFRKIVDAYTKRGIPLVEFTLIDIKEKWGALTIYLDADGGVIDEIDEILDDAERESKTICEICGKPGKLRTDAWFTTLCNEHDKKLRRDSQHG